MHQRYSHIINDSCTTQNKYKSQFNEIFFYNSLTCICLYGVINEAKLSYLGVYSYMYKSTFV